MLLKNLAEIRLWIPLKPRKKLLRWETPNLFGVTLINPPNKNLTIVGAIFHPPKLTPHYPLSSHLMTFSSLPKPKSQTNFSNVCNFEVSRCCPGFFNLS